MLRLSDVVIDPIRTLGTGLVLVSVRPAYVYEAGRKTDEIAGYRYTVALPERGFERISVRINGSQLMQSPLEPSQYAVVEFDGLELFVYFAQGQPTIGARATGIRKVS